MKRVPVVSSNIDEIGYDPATLTLEIAFKSGTYHYRGVSQKVYEALMAAPSKGTFLHAQIKGKYQCEKQ